MRQFREVRQVKQVIFKFQIRCKKAKRGETGVKGESVKESKTDDRGGRSKTDKT